LIRTFLGNPAGVRGARHVAWFQAASALEKAGLTRMSRFARNRLDLRDVEQTASAMLGCRFVALVSPYGGLSLDIDDESDYEIISENLMYWREHQKNLLPSFPPEPPAPEASERRFKRPFQPPVPAAPPGSRNRTN
jgi:hypothetical protein